MCWRRFRVRGRRLDSTVVGGVHKSVCTVRITDWDAPVRVRVASWVCSLVLAIYRGVLRWASPLGTSTKVGTASPIILASGTFAPRVAMSGVGAVSGAARFYLLAFRR